MKKIVLLCGLVVMLAYAESAVEVVGFGNNCFFNLKTFNGTHSTGYQTAMKKNPAKFYKRWALMYCLGYTSDDYKIFEIKGCTPKEADNPNHIDNMVKLFGDEPLNELKEKLGSWKEFDTTRGRVNVCFDIVYGSKSFQTIVEDIVNKYLIKNEYGSYKRKPQ